MSTVPQWLKKRVTVNSAVLETKETLARFSVNTVCESSACPNITECFSKNKATFMILGNACTRDCAFCNVDKAEPEKIDVKEPGRIADCAAYLGSKYVIITSVTRDDLGDGGAGQFVKTVEAIRRVSKDIVVELLIPDFASRNPSGFGAKRSSIEAVAMSGADIIGHNIETVKRLYPLVRRMAGYERSLDVLRMIKGSKTGQLTKSAILVGLGEEKEEVFGTMEDLRAVGCDMLAIGQYLRPGEGSVPVARFVTPEEFKEYERVGRGLGFRSVNSGPFVRSSYLAEDIYGKYNAAVFS